MIDESQITELLELVSPMPPANRLTLLDALTHLHLDPTAWRRVLPLANSLLTGMDESAAEVLARVPLRSIRESLRARTRVRDSALGRRVALTLAQQHDSAAIPRLKREFAAAPSADVAAALAVVLQPDQDVDAEDLRPGLAAADEMTRFWTALAMARVGQRGSARPDFEPLEQVWDAFVRPAGFLAAQHHATLLEGPPPLFHGDLAWAAAEVARARPLPSAAHDYLLKLKDNDFDAWKPRHDLVEDSSALRAFVSGLTGQFDNYGDAVLPQTDVAALASTQTISGGEALAKLDELLWRDGHLAVDDEARGMLSALDAPTAATLIERAFRRLATMATAAPENQPPWSLGNELLQLACQLPRDIPLSIADMLSNPQLAEALPRKQLAWVLARSGDADLIKQLAAIVHSSPTAQRAGWIEWLRDIALQIDAPLPVMGVLGGAAAPATFMDLIDDTQPLDIRAPGTAEAAVRAKPPIQKESESAAAPPDKSEASFLFLLRGAKARRDAICAHSEAALEFRYEVPNADALVVVDDDEVLNTARLADLDIMLELTTRGNLTLRGARSGVARFKQGALREPVVFQLSAGEVNEADSGVHVDFIVKGETVHQHELKLVIVADEAALARRVEGKVAGAHVPASLLDDATLAGEPPEHRVRLALALDSGGFRIDLTHWIGGTPMVQASFVAPGIDRARLEALVAGVRADLVDAFKGELWLQFDGAPASGQASGATRAALSRTLAAVAAAGSRLNRSLRDSDDALARALNYIGEKVPDGAALTIATNEVFLPWEILYPRPWSAGFTAAQKAQYPIDPAAFWGVRFAIETVQQQGSGSISALKKAQLEHAPKVSINLNPRISIDRLAAANQPLAVQQAWANRLKADGQLDSIQDQCTVMRNVLQDATSEATLIYVYCHGAAANPFGGGDELLLLDEDCKLTPNDLAGDTQFPSAPIVFLNACQSGAHSPLAFSTFLKEFRRRGALGMIAASFPIPIVFGAHFGAEVVDCYLRRTGSLAVALRGLRRKHLLERGNPVPLFYALQCQLSFPDPSATGVP